MTDEHRTQSRASWRERAAQLKIETLTLYYAYRDPRVSWYAKLLIALTVAYAFSPIDLIPDFVPVLGYLDDLLLIPLLVAVTIRLIPPSALQTARVRAAAAVERPVSRVGAVAIALFWLLAISWLAHRLLFR